MDPRGWSEPHGCLLNLQERPKTYRGGSSIRGQRLTSLRGDNEERPFTRDALKLFTTARLKHNARAHNKVSGCA
jgi:hypothetical protein